jgi:hypothetical protein
MINLEDKYAVFCQMILAGGKKVFIELMANVFKHLTK